jgi:predicted nucleic acid-binding Zn ribbon protein
VTERPGRACAWCHGPIPDSARADARFCSQRCRQASHRFHRGARQRQALGRPMRFAYADPPYPGLSRRYYAGHPDFAGEVDHARLVEQLCDGFPDGWALSTSAAALRDVLALCPADTRVAAWVRGERPARSYRPLAAWEPVVYLGGRPYLSSIEDRRVDALTYTARPRLTDPDRVVGAKPAAFCWWLFDLLGALPGDDLVDLFPGSGGIGRAWRHLSAPGGPDASCRTAVQLDASAGDDVDVSRSVATA